MSGWEKGFGALDAADQYKIREMATIFGVPVSVAYHRAKEFGLLSSAGEAEDSCEVTAEPVAYTSANGTFITTSHYADLFPSSQRNWRAVYSAYDFEAVRDQLLMRKSSEAALLEALKALSSSIFAPSDDRSPELSIAMQMTIDAIARATGSAPCTPSKADFHPQGQLVPEE